MVVDPTPKELAHWIYKEMQNNKQYAEYTVSWLLLSLVAKMKVKKCAHSGLDVEPSSDLGRSEVWSLASKPPREGKIMQGHQERPLRSLVTKKVVNVGGGQNQETTKTRR